MALAAREQSTRFLWTEIDRRYQGTPRRDTLQGLLAVCRMYLSADSPTLRHLEALLAAKDTQDTQGDIEKAPMLPVREMDSWEEQAATLDPFDSAAIDAVLIDNPTRSVGRPAVRILHGLAVRVLGA